LRFEYNSSSSYKHFTIQTHIVTKYGAHVYVKKWRKKRRDWYEYNSIYVWLLWLFGV